MANAQSTLSADADAPTGVAWGLLAVVSAIFFVSTGGAFSSLGVLLPAMIADLGWSWTQAGAGFTVLALTTGLSSTLPAWTLGRGDMRLVYLSGGVVIALGFALMATAGGLAAYIAGAGLVGVGYSQVGAVPAVKLLSGWFGSRRSFAIGVFFTSGALGSVAAPLAASTFLAALDSWRLYWTAVATLIGALCLAAALLVRERAEPADDGDNPYGSQTPPARVDWTLREAMTTPQFFIIVFGLTVTLLGTVTMNAWQVTHMKSLGVSAQVAAGALSAHALSNAFSRIVGGAIIDRIGAKWVFASGLAAGVVGMAALAVADTPLLIAIFAFGDGYSFGIVTFSTSILLLNYFGAKHNPAILGTLNLISTVAMIGPIAAGGVADGALGFAPSFFAIAAILAVGFVAAVMMRAPARKEAPR
ncbi:MAG: MFS transporter [Pseudomonadota bacterium]